MADAERDVYNPGVVYDDELVTSSPSPEGVSDGTSATKASTTTEAPSTTKSGSDQSEMEGSDHQTDSVSKSGGKEKKVSSSSPSSSEQFSVVDAPQSAEFNSDGTRKVSVSQLTGDLTSSASQAASAAFGFMKGAFAEAKLFTKHITGQIDVSDHDPAVSDAFMKLDAYKEQVGTLLGCAKSWQQSMAAACDRQSQLVTQLQESHTVLKHLSIPSVASDSIEVASDERKDERNGTSSLALGSLHNLSDDDENNEETKAMPRTAEEPGDATDDGTGATTVSSSGNGTVGVLDEQPHFADLCSRLGTQLDLDAQRLKDTADNAKKNLVIPLQNVLDREINHGRDIRDRYLKEKRQCDNLRTVLKNQKRDLAQKRLFLDKTRASDEVSSGDGTVSPVLGDSDDSILHTSPESRDPPPSSLVGPSQSSTAAKASATVSAAGVKIKSAASGLWSTLKSSMDSVQQKSTKEEKAPPATLTSAPSSRGIGIGGVSIDVTASPSKIPTEKDLGDLQRKIVENETKLESMIEKFESTKKQLFECVSVIELKLNMETEFLVKQFEEYVLSSAMVTSQSDAILGSSLPR